ncbi:MAG: hypothetical protein IJK30_07435 [Ruminococcus sp.]|nr:hypothetical protein [Ruminococcus sp.]
MTLDEAIKHCFEVAESKENEAAAYNSIDNIAECVICAADHRQLAEWLKELKEAKRLLKAAVEGYHFIGHITSDYACPSCTSCSACPMDEGKQCKIWKHADEALALIGGAENG